MAVPLTDFLGYAYGVAYLHDLDRVTGMAIHTAGCLLLLTASISAARPDRGLVHALTSRGPGRLLSRRVGPVLLVVPFIAGMLTNAAGRLTGPASQVLITIVVAGCVLMPITVLGRVAQTVDEADQQLRDEQEFTATVLRSSHAGVMILDANARIIEVNPRWCEQVSTPAERLLGTGPPFPWWPPEEADD